MPDDCFDTVVPDENVIVYILKTPLDEDMMDRVQKYCHDKFYGDSLNYGLAKLMIIKLLSLKGYVKKVCF